MDNRNCNLVLSKPMKSLQIFVEESHQILGLLLKSDYNGKAL